VPHPTCCVQVCHRAHVQQHILQRCACGCAVCLSTRHVLAQALVDVGNVCNTRGERITRTSYLSQAHTNLECDVISCLFARAACRTHGIVAQARHHREVHILQPLRNYCGCSVPAQLTCKVHGRIHPASCDAWNHLHSNRDTTGHDCVCLCISSCRSRCSERS
jgi:hypothetical protein